MTRRVDPGQVEVLDDSMAELLRRKSPEERLRIGFEMWTSARAMLTSHLRDIHPDWDQRMVDKEVARRLSHGAV